ncbi:MAG: ABC transporter permease subunit [Pseudomonadota bacterium]
MNHTLPRISVWMLAALLLAALLVPWISPYDYFTPAWDQTNLSPALAGGHLLGTDQLGRDLLVRLMWSTRISLLVALAASLISLSIGVSWGVTAGYLGGRTDALMMRLVDVLYSVPFTPFVIVLTVVFGRNLWLLFVAIGAVSWLDIARIVRGQTRSLRHREFVVAADIAGVSPSRIMLRHIVPNLMGIVIVYLTLTIPTVILTEAFLSYLGLGAQAPLTSLGVMLADGAAQMRARPLMLIMPATVLILLVYCCNRIGDRLRDRYAG